MFFPRISCVCLTIILPPVVGEQSELRAVQKVTSQKIVLSLAFVFMQILSF